MDTQKQNNNQSENKKKNDYSWVPIVVILAILVGIRSFSSWLKSDADQKLNELIEQSGGYDNFHQMLNGSSSSQYQSSSSNSSIDQGANNDWNNGSTNYKIDSYFTMDIPNTLELRGEGVVGQQYCFWPGLSSEKYARILVSYEDNPGISQSDVKRATSSDLKVFKESMFEQFESAGYSPSDIKIHKIEVQKISGKYAVVEKYTRPGLKGDVYCESYDFFIGDWYIHLIMSYRTSESSYWKTDFEKALKSIVWKI